MTRTHNYECPKCKGIKRAANKPFCHKCVCWMEVVKARSGPDMYAQQLMSQAIKNLGKYKDRDLEG